MVSQFQGRSIPQHWRITKVEHSRAQGSMFAILCSVAIVVAEHVALGVA